MAEVNAKDLTTKTAPASTDSMLLFGTTTNEGAKITVDNLAENILSRLSTKTFPNQVGGSSAATILAQLATLNSNLTGNSAWMPATTPVSGHIFYRKVAGIVFVLIQGPFTIETANQYTVIGVLPENYRPNTSIQFVCHATGGTQEFFGNIGNDGNINLYSPISGQAYASSSVSYPI